jgi:hypothetical protein
VIGYNLHGQCVVEIAPEGELLGPGQDGNISPAEAIEISGECGTARACECCVVDAVKAMLVLPHVCFQQAIPSRMIGSAGSGACHVRAEQRLYFRAAA